MARAPYPRRVDLRTPSGRPLSPLALAAHPQTPGACVDVALDAGINAFFVYDLEAEPLLGALATALPDGRPDVALITGTEARDPAGLRQDLDALRARLGVDVLDAFLLLYVTPTEDLDVVDRLLDELARAKEAGDIRAAGASAHDRARARRLAEDPRVDVLMHRYNMAHRGAEDAVWPAAQAAGTPGIAFTCTRWGTLLSGPPGWDGPVPTAADCYRFALAHPAVRLALTAPHTLDELRANLGVLEEAVPTPEELERWRAFGDLVHGGRPGAFETRWP